MKKAAAPNVLIIVADQLNARYVGAYGDTQGTTPTFDGLADAGTTFENAYCQAPLCMPSRASFNTGHYPHACRVRHNPVNLDPEFLTLAERLKREGYHTGGFGHLGGDGIERGFDEKLDFWDEPVRSAYGREQAFVLKDGGKTPTYCGAHPYPDDVNDNHVNAAALSFLGAVQQPFYLQISYMRPHIPLFVPEPFASMYDPETVPLPETWRDPLIGKPSNVITSRRALEMEGISEHDLKKALAVYRGSVTFVDTLAGRVISRLAELDMLDNTLIIVTSDHGDYAGEFGIIGKTGQFYDCLCRVPLIVTGPRIEKQKRVESPRALVDIVPTVLDVCGMKPDAGLHGRTLNENQDQRTVFASTSGQGEMVSFDHRWDPELLHPLPSDPYSSGPCSHVMDGVMARDSRWKLTAWRDGSRELYDMVNDPSERYNVAEIEENAGAIADLLQQIAMWQTDTWLPDVAQSPLPYHYRSAWIDSMPPSWREQRKLWDIEH